MDTLFTQEKVFLVKKGQFSPKSVESKMATPKKTSRFQKSITKLDFTKEIREVAR